jgi:hypothetical protein
MLRLCAIIVLAMLTRPCIAKNIHACPNLAAPATYTTIETNITWKTTYYSPTGPPHHDEPAGSIHRKARVEVDDRQAPGRHVIRMYLNFYEEGDRLPLDAYDDNVDVPSINFHLSDLPFVLKVLERVKFIGLTMMCQPGDPSGNSGYYGVFEFRDAADGIPIWPH